MRNVTEIAAEVLAARNAVKQCEDELKGLKEFRDNRESELADAMIDAECQSLNVKGYTLYLRSLLLVNAPAETKDQFYKALEANGFSDIVKPTVNANTLAAIVREYIENDGQVPSWMAPYITTYDQPRIGVKKS